MEVEQAPQEADDDQQVLLAVGEPAGALFGVVEPRVDVPPGIGVSAPQRPAVNAVTFGGPELST